MECPDDGGRLASSLGPVSMLNALTTTLRPIVKLPVGPYLEAMHCIEAAGYIPDLMEFAKITLQTAHDQKQFGMLRDDPLPADGIAFFMTYSSEATLPPFYKDLNAKCSNPDRSAAAPYGPFIAATVKYMADIEPFPSDTVFRGVKADLRADYPKGRKVTWHGFVSTTKNAQVLSNPQFCGEVGKRTIFAIKLMQGQARDITRYSLVLTEEEVLLPPGCRFEVESVLPQGDLTLIQIRELPSMEWILDLRTATGGGAGISQTKAANSRLRGSVLSCSTSVATYTCRMTAQIRAGCAIDSEKVGVLSKGDVIEAFEERVDDAGVIRVRFSKGWVSRKG